MKTSALGRARRSLAARSQHVLARVRGPAGDLHGLTREEARRRGRSKPGLFASLSPEARAYLRSYDGPENIGPPRGGPAAAYAD